MLKRLELVGFKSFAKKTELTFDAPITAIVGPNGSGKSNVAEAIRWSLGEQSMKSLRGKRGEDLIFNGSKNVGRMNRASVTLLFDNGKRKFNIDFDEVAITREVHRDGENIYSINGSQVRLKDVYELLSGVSLGASGHHIISQGEADRILNASLVERREMIEDALGLKIFQYKKAESERKLEKTEENLKQVEALRREIAPHIKFLKKQMEQVEKAQAMRVELLALYKEFFAHEDYYIKTEREKLSKEKSAASAELKKVEAELAKLEETISLADRKEDSRMDELSALERELGELRAKKDELSRKLGRIEGQLEVGPTDDFLETTETGEKRCAYCKQVIREGAGELAKSKAAQLARLDHLKEEKRTLEDEVGELTHAEKTKNEKYQALKKEINESMTDVRGAERALFDLKTKRNELSSVLSRVRLSEENLSRVEADFKRELGEAAVLVGREATEYPKHPKELESRAVQEDRRRKVERLKIRIEDAGGVGTGVANEFREVTERDTYLEKEIEDLEKSADSLKEIMADLTASLETKFKDGMGKINVEFQNFFELLFGGGNASLALIVPEVRRRKMTDLDLEDAGSDTVFEEESKPELGIDINVNLPRKKIRGLDMLSGGERALTSIALLFAMSQVNPPPFLVLDETDAALDEANSKKYGDMIERLSKHSQLILITHNRETMSRANVLYGVTMGAESTSTILSVKFDEAVVIAK